MTDETCPLCGSKPGLLPDLSGVICQKCPLPQSCWPAVAALQERVRELEAQMVQYHLLQIEHSQCSRDWYPGELESMEKALGAAAEELFGKTIQPPAAGE